MSEPVNPRSSGYVIERVHTADANDIEVIFFAPIENS